MLGAIAGDMIGSVYEFDNRRRKDFPLFTEATTFTDDTSNTRRCNSAGKCDSA